MKIAWPLLECYGNSWTNRQTQQILVGKTRFEASDCKIARIAVGGLVLRCNHAHRNSAVQKSLWKDSIHRSASETRETRKVLSDAF